VGLQTSVDHPTPVRTVANLLGQWIGRLGWVWVEGQVAQVTRRPGTATVFVTLRDPVADVSLSLTCPRSVYDGIDPPVTEGALVVAHARPQLYPSRGTLQLAADDIRPVGLGALLAQLERRRRLLAAEGLFDPARRRRLPFLPGVIGLVCGRGSAAEHDVVENATRRWPAVTFRIENVPVQGPGAPDEIAAAVRRLDADPAVDVVVLARGGGSVEDLLAFSTELVVRTVAAAATPVVSAIGHETDTPLVDLAADVAASTPTDAARRVVPDVGEESDRLSVARRRIDRLVTDRIDRESTRVAELRSRPVLADPVAALVSRPAEQLQDARRRCRAALGARLDRSGDDLGHVGARIRALSPQSTLDRGYAVLTRSNGELVTDPAVLHPGDPLVARLAGGRADLTVPAATVPAATVPAATVPAAPGSAAPGSAATGTTTAGRKA